MEQLDQQRARIQDDLRGVLSGDARCDDVFLQLYASDASVYEIRPLGVVRPRSAADVVACVQYAAAKQIPLHARGAGTGVAGESIGPGLVLDFSKYLRRIVRFDADRVRVQPGVVLDRLNAELRAEGRVFGPNPSKSNVTTLGSMIAVNAAGSRWLRYGTTRQHVLSLQVVLADGQLLEVGREPLAEDPDRPMHPRKRDLVGRLSALLSENADLIRQNQPKCPLSHCGYDLSDVLGDGQIDLARLLAGSEGTLALVTEATLATQPLPRHRGVALLLFDSLEKASRAVLEILPQGPAACDLMDRRYLSLARQTEVRLDVLIPAEAEAALLVEQEGDGPVEVRDWLHRLVDELWKQKRLAFGARQAFDQDEADLLAQLTGNVQEALHRVKGISRPVPVVEDVAVPPAALPEFLVQVQNVLKRHQITASVFCHAPQGQLHIEPFLDLADEGDVQRMRGLAEDLYQEVSETGGTICGEHACGLSRTSFIFRQAGPLYEVFRQVKRIFDPDNILNPGKIVGDDPELFTRNLRPSLKAPEAPAATPAEAAPEPLPEAEEVTPAPDAPEVPELRNLTELQLNWEPSRVADAVADCSRCGACRTQSAEMRMCPLFRFLPAEEASPRAKANLLRGVLTGQLELGRMKSEEFKEIADLCVHCHSCRLECPAHVDIPRLMREAKAAYVTANGLPPTQWLLNHLDLVGSLSSVISPVTNWAIGNRAMRWLMEKTLGIAQGRKLPRVAPRSFLRVAARRRLTRPLRRRDPKVAYFVDLYANQHDPQLGEALVAVLEHNGVAVYVPPEQTQAGMPSIASGALDHARQLARQNVAVLAETIRQGYHVVASEPAAALCLTHEYTQLLDDDDTRLVAAHGSEACTYLWKMHTMGDLQLDFRPIRAALGYHLPCHLRALKVGSPGENLLRLIPGLRVYPIEAGCSGMAGTFGLQHRNYRTSLRTGRRLMTRLRDPGLQAGTTECSTCKLQMEQGTTKPTIHPIKLLALSYGLMPEMAKLLGGRNEGLYVT